MFEELQGCIASTGNVEDAIEDMLLSEKLNCFFKGLPTEKRKIFYAYSIFVSWWS